jgi:glutaredoxin
VDHVPCLKAWAETFGGIHYPILSDFWPHGEAAKKYGVLREEGYSERAIFVIDDAGIIRYIDIHDIDEQPDNRILYEEIKKLRPGYVDDPIKQDFQPLPHGGIVMYCTRWCPECRMARSWFNENGIKYTEVDVMESPAAENQVRLWNKGNLTTPTFEIDGTVFSGFDKVRISGLLNTK